MHDEHKGNRPTPYGDGLPKLLKVEHCGFPDMETLEWWFRGHKRALTKAGFNVAVYLVPPRLIRYGEKQLLFERGDLVPVERLPLVRNGKVMH